jgi:hypothetical protein
MLPDLVSRAELIEILTQRMRCLPHGKNATVSDVIRLRHPDNSGCNWVPNFAATTSSVALLDVFATARSEFILTEE